MVVAATRRERFRVGSMIAVVSGSFGVYAGYTASDDAVEDVTGGEGVGCHVFRRIDRLAMVNGRWREGGRKLVRMLLSSS